MSLKNFGFSKETLEDLVQESFIKLFLNLDKFDSAQGRLSTWSSIIAKRTAINYHRSNKNRVDIMDVILEEVQISSTLVEVDFLAMDLVFKAIEELPSNYKDVFELAVFQSKEHLEIANELGISESTSRVYLVRARNLIQKQLAKDGINATTIVNRKDQGTIDNKIKSDMRS